MGGERERVAGRKSERRKGKGGAEEGDGRVEMGIEEDEYVEKDGYLGPNTGRLFCLLYVSTKLTLP